MRIGSFVQCQLNVRNPQKSFTLDIDEKCIVINFQVILGRNYKRIGSDAPLALVLKHL